MAAEAAVAEEIHAPPAETNFGDVFATALAKAHAAEHGGEVGSKKEEGRSSEAEPDGTKAESSEKATEKESAPASALDAALAEAPKTEDKAADADPLKDLPETLPNENRKDHWKNARTAIKSLSDERATLQKSIADLEAKISAAPKDNPEAKAALEKLQAENEQLRDAITAANVELLPEFRQKFIDGRKALVTRAQEKAKAYGGDPEALAEALAMPEGRKRDAAINEAFGEMDDTAKGRVVRIITDIEALDEQAADARANSQQSYERLTQKQQEQRVAQEQEIEGRKKATFENVRKKLQAEVPTLRVVADTVPGAEDWNGGINSAFEKSQRLFSNEATPEETVAAAVKGQDYDRVAGLLSSAWKELAQVKKQLAEYDGAQPDIKGGRAAAKSGKEAQVEKDPGQVYAETMAALSNRED